MKRAFVTGGSRGIGREIVLRLSGLGYSVAFTYKNSKSEAEAIARECGAHAIYADLECEESIILAAKESERLLGGVDILVNNAGISSFSLLQDLSTEEWGRTLAVNLTAPFMLCRALIPGMVSRHYGRIVNISSMWGISGSSCEAHYSASKAGLIGLTKALAKELGPSGITVNAVAPGLIMTDMNKCLRDEDIALVASETPLMRAGQPSEVADAVLYLVGEGASFITGEVLNVSGGYVM